MAVHFPDESDASTIAAGAPIEVDLAPIAEGQTSGVLARQADLHQPPHKKQIDEARSVPVSSLPDPQPTRPGSRKATTSGW